LFVVGHCEYDFEALEERNWRMFTLLAVDVGAEVKTTWDGEPKAAEASPRFEDRGMMDINLEYRNNKM